MQQLERSNVTAASRIMLPVHAGMSAVLGLSYTLSPDMRLKGPAMIAAQELTHISIEWWGILFLVVAVVQISAMLIGNGDLEVAALCFGASVFAMWSILYAITIFTDPNVSYSAFAWPLYVALAHIASTASLMRGEFQTP